MTEPYVLFEVADATYAVRAASVQRMEMVEGITRVPNAAPFVEGICYLRGHVVPVVSLRRRFGLEPIPYDLRSRLIVLDLAGRRVALAVDSAREFITLDSGQVQPPPDAMDDAFLEGIVALGDRLILILDLTRVVRAGEAGEVTEQRQGAPPDGE